MLSCTPMTTQQTLKDRIADYDWTTIGAELDAQGWALLPTMLSIPECHAMQSLYADDGNFRNRVVMARHGYGQGEYRYFSYPLPLAVTTLRENLYSHLEPVANRWQDLLRTETRYPAAHADFIARCHKAGQLRPTPLLLQYGEKDYNCLHQDIYGEHQFPFQVAILLSAPDKDFSGGEFILTEQRPRMQSRATVVPLRQGDAVVFAVNHRPAVGARGIHRRTLRHGVSTIRRGHRHTLGIIFHDAT